MTRYAGDGAGGLSPLARGTLEESLSGCRALRFIPAGAGNTFAPAPFGFPSPVYPRWRGDPPCWPRNGAGSAGLSPLARGTQWMEPLEVNIVRFIPAGAGNTLLTCPVIRGIPVYPRWRGEHTPINVPTKPPSGLSPLARGTLSLRTQQKEDTRFIPAGAGNTPEEFLYH